MAESLVEFVSSQKKSSDGSSEIVAIYKSYVFHKESVLDKFGNLKFRCANRHHTKCKARITVEIGGKLISEEPIHNHAPKPGDVKEEETDESEGSSGSRASTEDDLPQVPSVVIDKLIMELQLIQSNVAKTIEKLQSVKAAINGDPVSSDPSEANESQERSFINGLRQPKSEVQEYGY
ncbi:hypothetical protein FO519_004921 [Halicephalobus sp. NKZ332]|nr:hypothetical protein FO519_004921 [Halicephalobus sp. NKZ332]